jgi:hypothetical protein
VKAAQRHYGWWAAHPGFLVEFVSQLRWPWLTLPLASAGVVLAGARARAGDPFALLCIGYGVAQVAAYAALGAPAGYPWYQAAGDLAIDLAVALAVLGFSRALAARVRLRVPPPVLAASVALVLSGAGATPWRWPAGHPLAPQYREAGLWLRAHGSPSEDVALSEIGYVGWYAGLRVLDVHGLLHPEALSSLRAGNLHWWWDRGLRPRFVLTHTPAWHGEAGSRETWPPALNEAFVASYAPVARLGELRIFERAR